MQFNFLCALSLGFPLLFPSLPLSLALSHFLSLFPLWFGMKWGRTHGDTETQPIVFVKTKRGNIQSERRNMLLSLQRVYFMLNRPLLMSVSGWERGALPGRRGALSRCCGAEMAILYLLLVYKYHMQ